MARLRAEQLCRELFQLSFVLAVAVMLTGQVAFGGDLFRVAPAGGSAASSGTPTSGTGGTAVTPVSSTIDTAAQLQARAVAAIQRTDTAIRAVQAAQQAARAAAQQAASAVPNGLQTGGLEPLDLSVLDKWKGAAAPTTVAGKPNEVTIVQSEQQALLQWKTFNIGKDTTLTFDQSKGGTSAGEWIAFNFVQDPSAKPSQILGTLKTIGKADAKGNVPVGGQVYVLNPNGILFGGASQVNVHGLVASTLPINEALVQRGLLTNETDRQFLFSASELNRSGEGIVTRTYGDVIVEQGAVLQAATDDLHYGGRIALFGSNVTNHGTIKTPDGQAILAAGLQIGLEEHNTDDPSIRGLDVYVGAVAEDADGKEIGGLVTNDGYIDVPLGNATLVGRKIDHLGVIDSKTSVSYNGSVTLDASYGTIIGSHRDDATKTTGFLRRKTGQLTLGTDSILRILPDWASDEKVVGEKLALVSKIALRGMDVHFAGGTLADGTSKGATLLAPSASVDVAAGVWRLHGEQNSEASDFVYEYLPLEGEAPKAVIRLDSGASIDVSGTTGEHAKASVSDNVIKVELRGAEFANSPVQRDGELRGETVYIDIRQTGKRDDGTTWVGTPLGDVSGYVNLVEREIGVLTTQGGTVSIRSGGEVAVGAGAAINVSGGFTSYTGGEVRTTKILDGDRVIDIAKATADQKYDGIYEEATTTTDSKWGATHSSVASVSGQLWEDGYVQGASGGSLAITAPSMALAGTMQGQTVVGERQRKSATDGSYLARPASGLLALNFNAQHVVTDDGRDVIDYRVISYEPTTPKVVLGGGTAAAVDADLALSTSLFGEAGFGVLKIVNGRGDIVVADRLTGVAGGSLELGAANVSVLASISAPGGSLSFNAYNYSPLTKADNAFWYWDPENEEDPFAKNENKPAPTTAVEKRGCFLLASGAALDTAGLLVDDRFGAAPLLTAGGSVSINGYSVALEGATGGKSASAIDVSGGAVVSASGKVAYGKAGSVSIAAGQDPVFDGVLGGDLQLGATLSGYAGTGSVGGSLSLRAPSVQVGGATARASTLLLAPEFFAAGGFGSYSVTGIGEMVEGSDGFVPGLLIAKNTAIQARQWNRDAMVRGTAVEWSVPTLSSYESLRTPVKLSFAASGLTRRQGTIGADLLGLALRGELVVEEGAKISTDARGVIALSGQTVAVGKGVEVTAAGGEIAVTGEKDSYWLFGGQDIARPTVVVESGSVLSTKGTVLLQPLDARGNQTGSVLAGGKISLTGNIVARQGAVLDVSGTSGTVDRLPEYSGNGGASRLLAAPDYVATPEASNGGRITLAGSQLLVADATMKGVAGGASAKGGELVISSDRYLPSELSAGASSAEALDVRLRVRQSDRPVGVAGWLNGPEGSAFSGGGFVVVDRFSAGGFDRIELKGTTSFEGPVALSACGSLVVGEGSVTNAGVIYTDDAVTLSAPYVKLGRPFWLPEGTINHVGILANGKPSYFAPSHGTGVLTVNATELIDVGDLSLQNTGRLNLHVASGDLRGNGILDVAGAVDILAGQVYPTTQGVFTITAYDVQGDEGDWDPGSITIRQGERRSLPFSVGGELRLYASEIHQGGTLRAPIGTIALGWDGNGTAPRGAVTNLAAPVATLVDLKGGSLTSVTAIDPITGKDLTLPYGLLLNGTAWIDPRGDDITAQGLPEKKIELSATEVRQDLDANVDLRGGGDLQGYRWVSGNAGRLDVLAAETSFAVIPTYTAGYAPYAPYNNAEGTSATLGSDRGYTNSTLKVGDRIYLAGSAALPAGEYTLLPARYALLPGAVLVTSKSGVPPATALVTPEGASLVSGYRYNGLDPNRTAAPLYSAFEVAPQKVVEGRARYDDFSANKFFKDNAIAAGTTAPRLPGDAGQLVLSATERLALRGAVLSQAATGFRNGLVDLALSGDVRLIGATATASSGLVLGVADLNAIKAESLLIGGYRRTTSDGVQVTATADSLTLDNAGTALVGSDVTLAAKERVELAAGAELRSSGTVSSADALVLGEETVAGSGDGALVRVSADAEAQTIRRGVSALSGSETGSLAVVGAGAVLSGSYGMVDSSHLARVDSSAQLKTDVLALGSGRIAVALETGDFGIPAGTMVLTGGTLDGLFAKTEHLSLHGYRAIDFFGSGQFGGAGVGTISLHTAEINGYGAAGANVAILAGEVAIDNLAGFASATSAATSGVGTLAITTETLRLGDGVLAIRGFSSTTVEASRAVVGDGDGSLRVVGDLALGTPLLTTTDQANLAIESAGTLQAGRRGAAGTVSEAGLGGKLSLTGESVTLAGTVRLPSGSVTAHATAGLLTVDGALVLSGTKKKFVDETRYTHGGTITLVADSADVALTENAVLDVSAVAGGGDAGMVRIDAAKGELRLPTVSEGASSGSLRALAPKGNGGSMVADLGAITLDGFAQLQRELNAGGFDQLRSFRLRNGDLEVSAGTTIRAATVRLAADGGAVDTDDGNIVIRGAIDASGERGGQIDLVARGDVALEAGSLLTAAGAEFDAAGKGGRITLEAGSYLVDGPGAPTADSDAEVAIREGAKIDLSIAAKPASVKIGGIEYDLGQRSGTLHLRAPQNAATTDLQIASIDGTIVGASSIVAEGCKVFDVTLANGGSVTIAPRYTSGTTLNPSSVEQQVYLNGVAFCSAEQTASITDRLLANNAGLRAMFHLQPGAEIVNRKGDLVLDHAWDLSTYRFGPGVDSTLAGSGEPGTLTLRASGDLVFSYNSSKKTLGSLSDGFTGGTASLGGLVDQKLQGAGVRSWSYRLIAGADFSAADRRSVVDVSNATGSIVVGRGTPALPTTGTNNNRYQTGTTSTMIPARYQTIRTGTGDIDLRAAYDVQLLNNVATIYTAGQQAAALAGFDVPLLEYASGTSASSYGYSQTPYLAQYAVLGGNVSITAGHDIAHFAETKVGGKTALVADSSKELPSNWLYRRSLVDADTGLFVERTQGATEEAMSTTWWVDYSNFYEGVATLGGGNVILAAAGNVTNVDAAVATNARMAGRDADGNVLKPDAAGLVELGGGDLVVRAGGDLDAGVYYVERGRGTIDVGGSVHTNATRSTVLPQEYKAKSMIGLTQLPTTLFLGKGGFDVSAVGDLLMGSVANPFLLPSGINNMFYNRTVFSTYAADSEVSLTSVTGAIEVRNNPAGSDQGSLVAWYSNALVYAASGSATYANLLPWLRLSDIQSALGGRVSLFRTATSLLPAQFRATAFSGEIRLSGQMNLFPSAQGALDLLAEETVSGFQVAGQGTVSSAPRYASSVINFSDADPTRIPGIVSPIGGSGRNPEYSIYRRLDATLLSGFDALFAETGRTDAALAAQQNLHAAWLLHGQSDDPVRIYSLGGDITGLTLYSGKKARVVAGNDISDIALYLQNNRPEDVSLVSAGRDIVAFNPSSTARLAAAAAGGQVASATASQPPAPGSGTPAPGDIQISGPGSIEVLAGRNLELGVDTGGGDGVRLGLTSVGSARNPALAQYSDGSAIYVLAGIGYKWALQGDTTAFNTAIEALLNPSKTGSQAARFLPTLGQLMGLSTDDNPAVWAAFSALAESERRLLANALADQVGLGVANGIEDSALDLAAFTSAFLNPSTGGARAARYLPVLGKALGLAATDPAAIWAAYSALSVERRAEVTVDAYFLVLRQSGVDYNSPASPLFGDKDYPDGFAAVKALFPGGLWKGDISLTSREIKTSEGGGIRVLAPGGTLTVGLDVAGKEPLDEGIITERGGAISIFTHGSVNVGTTRIFTLRGGEEIIWSSTGDIAAGSSSKTVASAPPKRIVFDPTSADVKTDLSGLATGGGIGVLATRKDVKADDIYLIAPAGAIDAGDAGIKSSGNLVLAARTIVNAANISTGGASTGVPAVTAPSIGGVAAAASSASTGSTKSAGAAGPAATAREAALIQELPSLIEVQVIGYGGGEGEDDEEKDGDSDSAKGSSEAEQAESPAESEQAAAAAPVQG